MHWKGVQLWAWGTVSLEEGEAQGGDGGGQVRGGECLALGMERHDGRCFGVTRVG